VDWAAEYTINGERWVRIGPHDPLYEYAPSGWAFRGRHGITVQRDGATLLVITDDGRAWWLSMGLRYEWNPASGKIHPMALEES
jgi:hypothetical protein